MVEKKPVSVNWQSLFILIPIVDLWASYRVQKLRLYLLIFYLGFGLGGVALEYAMFPEYFMSDEYLYSDDFGPEGYWQVWIAVTIAGFALAVIMIRRWSKKWNEQFSRNG